MSENLPTERQIEAAVSLRERAATYPILARLGPLPEPSPTALRQRIGRPLRPIEAWLYGLVRRAVWAGYPGMHLSQVELARLLGVTDRTVRRAVTALSGLKLLARTRQYLTRADGSRGRLADSYRLGPAAYSPGRKVTGHNVRKNKTSTGHNVRKIAVSDPKRSKRADVSPYLPDKVSGHFVQATNRALKSSEIERAPVLDGAPPFGAAKSSSGSAFAIVPDIPESWLDGAPPVGGAAFDESGDLATPDDARFARLMLGGRR